MSVLDARGGPPREPRYGRARRLAEEVGGGSERGRAVRLVEARRGIGRWTGPGSINRFPPHMPRPTPKTDGRNAGDAKPKTWRTIVLEAFETKRGEPVRLAVLYAIVEKSPDAKVRAATNRNIRAKVRQQCQVLRRLGIVERVGPGVWMLPKSEAPAR